jgi:uncharacterized protein
MDASPSGNDCGVAGPQPEEVVRHPMVHQRWRDVSFLHWRCDPDTVQLLLPPGLRVDTFDGAAWVGLTPFGVEDSRPHLMPAVPGLSSFPETNLRTYVIGPDGRDGLWFLTLEADSIATVAVARGLLGLPYRWAAMDIRRSESTITYESLRRTSRRVGHHISIEPGGGVVDGDEGLAGWLTGRWRAWTRVAGRFAIVPAQHKPWPLVAGRLVQLDQDVTVASGLAMSHDPETVHFSPGVRVILGWPTIVR